MQALRQEVTRYLASFGMYDWLWTEKKEETYAVFQRSTPLLDDYAVELRRFEAVEESIEGMSPLAVIGALALNTRNLKLQLSHECGSWKILYSEALHSGAKKAMTTLVAYMSSTQKRLSTPVMDLESLRYVMDVLREVRERESSIALDINPVMDKYTMLERYLPSGYIGVDEQDQRTLLRTSWRKLGDEAEAVQDRMASQSDSFRAVLVKNIATFKADVSKFRAEYLSNGPKTPSLPPLEAVERLRRFKDEAAIHRRKYESYRAGERLFGLPESRYEMLVETEAELQLLTLLYDLFVDVERTRREWQTIEWLTLREHLDAMDAKIADFAERCHAMPKELREFPAYRELNATIEDFERFLPMVAQLSKPTIKVRHWGGVMKITGGEFSLDASELKLATLFDANLTGFADEIGAICLDADREWAVECQLTDIMERWSVERFTFASAWRNRAVPTLANSDAIVAQLDEAQTALQAMLALHYIGPFRAEARSLQTLLSETADTLARWSKVQQLWCALEPVFTSGDIARQNPKQAKRFLKVDKDFEKLMAKAATTSTVVGCCANQLLRSLLPLMFSELEGCQKSLAGYLEAKRAAFPPFFFVSDPQLLQILSTGASPAALQGHYAKIFPNVRAALIVGTTGPKSGVARPQLGWVERLVSPAGEELFLSPALPVRARAPVEDWLFDMRTAMRRGVRDELFAATVEIFKFKAECGEPGLYEILLNETVEATVSASGALKTKAHRPYDTAQKRAALRAYVRVFAAQFAIFGLQSMWAHDVASELIAVRSGKAQLGAAYDDLEGRACLILETLAASCWDAGRARRKVEALVTVAVNQRDVVAQLRAERVATPQAFTWTKQLRCVWDETKALPHFAHGDLVEARARGRFTSPVSGAAAVPIELGGGGAMLTGGGKGVVVQHSEKESFDGRGASPRDAVSPRSQPQTPDDAQGGGTAPVLQNGAAVISITDLHFEHQCDFVSGAGRLVVTPLTDRVCIALAQSLAARKGGCLVGPAGTGLTSTVQDLGAALGVATLVTNCNAHMTAAGLRAVFKGLAMSGGWGCFDDFNRIDAAVLSVVAMQLGAVQQAMLASTSHAGASFVFPGDDAPTRLDAGCAFFVTLNPGYAGRSALPHNLTRLFKRVAVFEPDREEIIRVMMYARAFGQQLPVSSYRVRAIDVAKAQAEAGAGGFAFGRSSSGASAGSVERGATPAPITVRQHIATQKMTAVEEWQPFVSLREDEIRDGQIADDVVLALKVSDTAGAWFGATARALTRLPAQRASHPEWDAWKLEASEMLFRPTTFDAIAVVGSTLLWAEAPLEPMGGSSAARTDNVFAKLGALATKVSKLYELCAAQLSPQAHYDFAGLRNVVALVRDLGEAKLANPTTADETLVYRMCLEKHAPKLGGDDLTLFRALLADLFPTSAALLRDESKQVAQAAKARARGIGRVAPRAKAPGTPKGAQSGVAAQLAARVALAAGGGVSLSSGRTSPSVSTAALSVNAAAANAGEGGAGALTIATGSPRGSPRGR